MTNSSIQTIAIINLDQRFSNECYLCSRPIKITIGPGKFPGIVKTYAGYDEEIISEDTWLFIALDNYNGLPTAHLLCGTCGAKHHTYTDQNCEKCSTREVLDHGT